MRNMTNPKAPIIPMPMPVTFTVVQYSCWLGFLVTRKTLTVSFINLFKRLGFSSGSGSEDCTGIGEAVCSSIFG